MTRFQALEKLAALAPTWTTIAAMMPKSGNERDTFRRQLNVMARYGYALRRKNWYWRRDLYVYKISQRGKKRLRWARQTGKLR